MTFPMVFPSFLDPNPTHHVFLGVHQARLLMLERAVNAQRRGP